MTNIPLLVNLLPNTSFVKVAIFDLDGTLINSMEIHKLGYIKIFRKNRWHFNEKIWESKAASGGTLWLQEMLESNQISNVTDIANKIKIEKTKWFINNINKTQIIRPVFKALKWYHSHNITTVCATTALDIVANRLLLAHDLSKYFDIIITAKDVPSNKLKPNPYIYNLVLKRLKDSPDTCVVYEDSQAGTQAAFSAGIPCVNITTSQYLETPLNTTI